MKNTLIQWCDDSLSLAMGCTGCELWNPTLGIRRCYAGQLTKRFGGRKGWPNAFEEPKVFAERINSIKNWSDLRGISRPTKPWLDGFPRTIFLNDMGDTFTEGLPVDWLAPFIPTLAATPHKIITLTKRAHRMAEFFNAYGVPKNFWLCTSITNHASLSRIPKLLTIKDAPVLGLSIEPLWEDVAATMSRIPGIERIGWVKIGGESGNHAKHCDVNWIRNLVAMFRRVNPSCAVFVKQLGTYAFEGDHRIVLDDWEGGVWTEWPADIKIREMPVGVAA